MMGKRMLKVLLIADDLTGTLDAGIKFAEKGFQTLVVPTAECWTSGKF